MKKIIITLVLGFIVSMQSFASNSINIFTKNSKLPDVCLNAEVTVYFGECSDGSSYYAGCDVIVGLGDCEEGTVDILLGYGSDGGFTEEEGCGG